MIVGSSGRKQPELPTIMKQGPAGEGGAG